MLVPGDVAPEFDAPTSRGDRLRLSALRGRRVVLFFYPKAGSLGCTYETKEFARQYRRFQEGGVEVVGVSVDSPTDQSAFAAACEAPFPLVADVDREIARRYGVLGAFGHAKRVTFLLDGTGRVVDIVESVLPRPHVERAAEAFLRSGGGPPSAGNANPAGSYSSSK